MALDSTTVMVAGTGHFYTAPVDTAKPSSTARFTPTTPWVEIGHTDSSKPLQVNTTGGGSTVLRSWQSSSLRETRAASTKALAFSLLQQDATNLKLYYGSNATVATDGSIQPADNPVGTEVALYVVIWDGAYAQDRYYPRVSIIEASSETFDIANLSTLPVEATILTSPTNKLVAISPATNTAGS